MFTGVQRPVLKFSEICTFSVLYKAYLAARRGKRSRAATANYEVHLLANIVNLVYILQTKIYRPGLFRVFYVYEPKKRLVQAPAFVDKVVQHALVDNLIYERITNSFILDNYASQKGKGLHFGLDRLRGFFTEYWNKYRTAEGWVLKADVRHFFASIDHDKLKEKLKRLDLEPIVFDLLCTYIDSTDGLPLGYQTSQLFALLFLDEFDHFVKERLHIRWYGRYMDDFFLIHPDKDYLQFCLKEIRAFMASLGLELNEKTQIFPIRNGIDFLGFHTYLTEEGKVIRKLRHSSIKRMRSKLRRWEQDYPAGLVTREKILQSWQAWDAHAAHGNTWSLVPAGAGPCAKHSKGGNLMATTTLGNKSTGSIIKLKENGTLVDFYVAKHDYESSLNGAGRTLVVRKDTYDDRVWDNGNVNAYASSDLDSWFNSTYKNMLDADIRSLIGTDQNPLHPRQRQQHGGHPGAGHLCPVPH